MFVSCVEVSCAFIGFTCFLTLFFSDKRIRFLICHKACSVFLSRVCFLCIFAKGFAGKCRRLGKHNVLDVFCKVFDRQHA